MGAGGSAQREYLKRRERRARARRQNRWMIVSLTVVIGVAAGIVVHLVLGAVIEAGVVEWSGGQRVGVAAIAGALIAVYAGAQAWAPVASTEAWGKGAAGERMTAAALERLGAEGFRVFHDRRIPGRRSNIDHIVIGPTGAFVVETKNYSGKVEIRRRSITVNGRRRDTIIEQAKREASVVASALGIGVTPVLCIHGSGIRGGGRRPVVDGVLVCSGRRLASRLSEGQRRLESHIVGDLAAIVGAKFPPAAS